MLIKMLSAATFAMLAITPTLAVEPTDASPKALSFKECGAQYQVAKAAGSLNGLKWMDYRKQVCRIAAPAYRQPPTVARSEAASAEMASRLAFPAVLAAEFSAETPSKARMRTCLKSYHEAKKAGALYGVKWIQKGGGYYSLCSAKLRGAPKA